MPQVKSKRYFIVMQSFTMEEQPKNECFSSSILFISFVPQFQHLKGPIKVQDRGGVGCGGCGKNATNNLYKQKLTPKLFCLLHDVVHLPTYLPTYCRRYLNSNKLNIRELNVL